MKAITSKTLIRLAILGLLGIACMVTLFLLSENEMHRNNAFIRRYPHHPISKTYDLDLKYNSYYIAGHANDLLYLGNTTAPLHLLEVNLITKDTNHIRIKLDEPDLPFRSIRIGILAPYFFVMDGSVPCIFRGSITDWKAHLWMKDHAYFTRALPIDPNTLYIKTISSKTNEAVLGIIEKQEGTFNVTLNPNILERQLDGMFDVDGTMLVSGDNSQLGYVYFYRNQFMVMNPDLELLRRAETIDTVQVAKIQLSQRNAHGEIKMKAPPLQINKGAVLYQDLVMVQSDRLGKYEDKAMLDQAAIIDVYNWNKQTYQFSFYLYTIGKKKVKAFTVCGDRLVAIIEDELSVFRLKPTHFKKPLRAQNMANGYERSPE
ncbi:hypothetical protein [Snuella lapsa]|uniref:Uncharacterized protein n=1 Tax=Snuella lapsa TaxID=870481 RepID=A0ABP6Y0C1_9FLAO